MSARATNGGRESEKLRVLLIEDDPVDKELVLRELCAGGFEPEAHMVQSEEEFLAHIGKNQYHVILADYNLPRWRGTEALSLLNQRGLDIPVILVTGSLGDEMAVECIKRGTTDYVLKDHLPRLCIAVRRALAEKHQREARRHAEEELEKKVEELARSNRDLEQFAYVASHDLQEPLRMVATYAQLLGERYKGKLDDKADKYIAYAVDGALRMQALINDLLLYSRVGRQHAEPQQVDCADIVERAVRNLRTRIEEQHAILKLEKLPVLFVEPLPLVQVFQNLVSNALKFHRPEPPRIEIRADQKDGQWIFSVTDNGIGIDPEHAEDIFVIFKRLHSRSEYPGSGIGLAICKKIIDQMGGSIWVESTLGRGSTFKFTLPAGPSCPPKEVHEFAGADSAH
jgi:signal transduction histidine kinase